jgi:NAD(P)-dependent dehydrogenase (short-subunit alcohol dehydrogenase family)
MGLAIARRFAAEGYALALVARSADALAGYARELAAGGAIVEAFPADLCSIEQVRSAFADIRRRMGDADVLVYNGARWHEVPAMAIDPVTFNADIALSVTGALVCAQQVHPAMKAAGRGTMLFTGGGLALKPEFNRGVSSLTAGKSALRGLVYAMAGELAPEGIHAATVTIAGTVAAGTPFDPDIIAQAYVDLHRQPAGAWAIETVFSG